MPLPASFRRATSAALFACLAAWASSSAALARPTDEQLQSWLHHEVDGPLPWLVAPFEPGPESVKVGHALLDALWAEPTYRSHLHAWLDAHAAAAGSSDELLSAWERHYHEAFARSFEFQADVRTQVLWLAEGEVGIARQLPREFCQSRSPEEIRRLRSESARQVIAKMGDTIVKAVTTALVKEFDREEGKGPPRRDDGEVMAKVSLWTLHATMDTLSAADSKRLYDQFSYQAPQVGPQEQCEREWVASDALLMSQLKDLEKGISSGLLRQSVTQASYSERFRRLDGEGIALGVRGFEPGKAMFHRPVIMVRNGAVGGTRVRLRIDEAGRYLGASIDESTLAPARLTAADGSQVAATEPLLAALDAYFREGRFAPHVVDGGARAYDWDVQFDWR